MAEGKTLVTKGKTLVIKGKTLVTKRMTLVIKGKASMPQIVKQSGGQSPTSCPQGLGKSGRKAAFFLVIDNPHTRIKI